ncbi:nuclear transport factor 2 family protein [Cellulophaga omnivescoria]|uniref:nuclear transport factor 2 family protein n=1 Tax=Cellulophaga omnivescoria TaxID=1888890 RepID=UPI0022F0EE8D|nr:nuclear transport factor 2 family protein [Cellulophaga omnivescoria]WBU90308.1 nuclear transport factor 2 family protein [Cellulophaga omnivescoria]WKB82427.1 nuclear transport factor 2 family protein [Cellulophaga lytica]
MYTLGVLWYKSVTTKKKIAISIAALIINNNAHMKHFFLTIGFLIVSNITVAQTDRSKIETTILNYINGTSYNQPKLIEKAFYANANLYLENKEKTLWVVPAKEYIGWYKNKKQGEFNGRIGNIISIDNFEGIATAKAEILFPESNSRYIDMFLLKKIKNQWEIISKSAASENSNQQGNKILFIVSNASFYGDSDIATGNSFSEITNAYTTFKNAGYTVDFVSPNGGSIPLTYIDTSDPLQKNLVYNKDFMYALKHTKKPIEIIAKNYKAVHYIGGGSAMYGVPENKDIQKIAMEIYEEHNGIISSVCHGTAGIVNLKTKDGRYVYEGKIVNGYPDSFEKKDAEYFKHWPFLIQKTIEERGGIFQFSKRNTSQVEVQGNLITGQNYLSSKDVALQIIERLKSKTN